MRDDPRCLHCGLRHRPDVACIPVFPAPGVPSEWPRIEAEREARIRADERARIVAYLRRLARAQKIRVVGQAFAFAAFAIEAGRHMETSDVP